MSGKHLSPTAAALRSSRFFSLPSPLPRPDTPSSGIAASNPVSNTATASQPTRQAITTPPRSLGRGDWGLKRPLPLRSTARSSTPFLRINAVDTREHITDFDSASDLSITLQKFQELGLPITKPEKASNSSTALHRSVFEPERDHTDPDAPASDPLTGRPIKRWKHRGPYLAGMTEVDFQEYIQRVLRGRKQEFLDFVRLEGDRRLPQEKLNQRTVSGERGNDVKQEDGTSLMTDAEFDDFLRTLRSSGTKFEAHSDLARLVNDFLDLPRTSSAKIHFSDIVNQLSDSPPPMHPSGGLGYLRTDSILRNHPVFGPQAKTAPQVARVVQQANSWSTKERLGVAGFVVEGLESFRRTIAYDYPDGINSEANPQLSRDISGKTIGLAVEGGNRLWVEPRTASIDEKGRVQIDVRTASAENIGAYQMNPDLGQVVSGKLPKVAGVEAAKPLMGPKVAGLSKADSRQAHKGVGAYGMSGRVQDMGDIDPAVKRQEMNQLVEQLQKADRRSR